MPMRQRLKTRWKEGRFMNKIKSVVRPVAEEIGQLAKVAGEQIVSPKSGEAQKAKEDTKDVVKHLYAKSGDSKVNPDAKKAEEEAQKRKLRQELHSQYYQSLNRPKPQEERPAEKVEKEKMRELVEKDEKEKKKKPIIVQRAQQSVEKFRGAAG